MKKKKSIKELYEIVKNDFQRYCHHCFCQTREIFGGAPMCCHCGFSPETPEEAGKRIAEQSFDKVFNNPPRPD